MAEGDVVLTLSNRQTTPFPKIDISSNRKCGNTVKRVEKWLLENGVAEAVAKRDKYNSQQFQNINPLKITQAEKDGLELYLFE